MTILVAGGTGHLERVAGQPPNVHIDRGEGHMSTAQESSNKATFRRFHDATNSGDVELIARTIDELVEPNAVIHPRCRSKRPGRDCSRRCSRGSFGPIPTFTSPSRI
jgi:hypothetical protein